MALLHAAEMPTTPRSVIRPGTTAPPAAAWNNTSFTNSSPSDLPRNTAHPPDPGQHQSARRAYQVCGVAAKLPRPTGCDIVGARRPKAPTLRVRKQPWPSSKSPILPMCACARPTWTCRPSFSKTSGSTRAKRAARRSIIAAPIQCITSISPKRASPSSSASVITPPARTISRHSPRCAAPPASRTWTSRAAASAFA